MDQRVPSMVDEPQRAILMSWIERLPPSAQHLLDSLPQLVWTATAMGTIDYCSGRIAEYEGAYRDPATGLWSWEALVHPDDRPATEAAWQKALQSGGDYHAMHRLRMRDGTARWHLSRAHALRDTGGRLSGWFGTATDIHEHVLMQERLHAEEDAPTGLPEDRRRADVPQEHAPSAVPKEDAGTDVAMRLRALDVAPVLISYVDRDRRYRFVNKTYERWFGVTRSEVVGRTITELLGKAAVRTIDSHIETVLSGRPTSFEQRIPYPNGLRHIHAEYIPDIAEDGTVPGYFALIRDISEERRREAHLSAMLQSVSDGFYAVDADWRFTVFNAAAERHHGLSRSEVIGRLIWDVFPQKLGTPFEARLREAARDRRHATVETVSITRPDRMLELRLSPLPDGGLAVTFTDITDRKTALSELAASEALAHARADEIEAIYNATPLGLVLFDTDFRFLRLNERLAEINGRPVAEHLGRPIEEVLGLETVTALHGMREALLRGEAIDGVEIAASHPDDPRPRWWHTSYRGLRDARGTVTSILGTVLEITDRMEAEKASRESAERLRIATRSAGLGVFEWITREDRLVCENARAREILGVTAQDPNPASVAFIADHVLPADAQALRTAIEGARTGSGPVQHVCRIRRHEDDTTRWVELSGSFVSGQDRLLGVLADVTDRLMEEEHRQLLVNELNHRVKNTLAVVQGIASQTFRGEADPAARHALFQGRLTALSSAQDILTQEGWRSASLSELVTRTLAAACPGAGRVSVEGPDLLLPPKSAVTLAIAVHELCTNAVKYGALSTDPGRVELRWDQSDTDERGFWLTWTEIGGPEVTPPTRKGFGSRMLEQALAHEFQADVVLDFRPEGLACRISGRLPADFDASDETPPEI